MRKKAELSLRKFAKKIGVSASFVSDMELGHRNISPWVAAKYTKLEEENGGRR